MEASARRKPEEIIDALRQPGEAEAVEEEASGDEERPPALVSESAEGVTTFAGFADHHSTLWFKEAEQAIAEAFPPPTNGGPQGNGEEGSDGGLLSKIRRSRD